jgi:hypothetical protein
VLRGPGRQGGPGTPDEAAKTIAWRAHTGDGTKLARSWKLAAAGGYTWDFVATTGDKTVFEMKGDHTARKK